MFHHLYDESKPLDDRLAFFLTESESIVKEIYPDKKLAHYQTKRTLSLYLSLRYPNKYYLYKNGMYNDFCVNTDFRKKPGSGKKYQYEILHEYYEMCEEIRSVLVKDEALIEIHNNLLTDDIAIKDDHHLLTQDFIYYVSAYMKKDKEVPANSGTRYWLYAPGESANKWDEFYKDGIMALGWDDLGDLSQYKDKEEIVKLLQKLQNTTGSKKNDSTANWEFANVISIGDIVIAKKGKHGLVGYGRVISEFKYDDDRKSFKNYRRVEWLEKGSWETPFSLVPKTLTDVTKYSAYSPQYNKYYEELLGIMKGDKIDYNNTESYPLNSILYGPPGTGKTYNTLLRAAQIIEDESIDDYKYAQEIFNQHLGNQIEFITFHQNYSYEDFIQGLRPDIENGTELMFERKDGVFKRIADRALRNLIDSKKQSSGKKSFESVFSEFVDPLLQGEAVALEVQMKKKPFRILDISDKSILFEKPSGGTGHTLSISTLRRMYETESIGDIQGLSVYYRPLLNELLKLGKQKRPQPRVRKQNYVIIIDEINRANISRVFGELITLIEPDKRSHGKVPLKCTLPSGEEFIVPSNLYLIGTMNTADKSIALLDIALRRRFEFEAMYPKYELKDHEIYDVEILKKINEKIITMKGHDFQIGHAYFMGDNKELVPRMNKKVIPILLEYFMNDEKEVKGILKDAGLEIEKDSWPLRITGKQ